MKSIVNIITILCWAMACLLASSTAFAAEKKLTIRVGYENNPGDPFDLAVNKWKQLVAERSKGSIELLLFPSSQLGSKADTIDQILAGDAIITIADGAYYADRGAPDLGIVFGPYLFHNWDECFKLTQSPWWADQIKLLEKKGLKVMVSNWIYGDRHLLTTKPVRSVQDLKGMKIRVPNNTIQIKGMEVMGATPTPMPLSEVYTALQQHVIDGLENPVPVLYNGKFQEIAKYLTLDGHVKNFTTWLTGTDFYNTLSEEQRTILIEAGIEAGTYNNELQQCVVEETIAKMKAEGVEVITINQEAFAQAAGKFYTLPEMTAHWSPKLYETVKAAMQ